MKLLTHSASQAAKRCLRQYYYQYVLGLRRAVSGAPLRIGSAVHLGLELHAKGETSDAAILAAVKSYDEGGDDYGWQIERETVAALLAGYFWYYLDTWQYVSIEKAFELSLLNPDTGAAARTRALAGKMDGLIRLSDGRLFVLEHKTTGDAIEADAPLWLRLRCDQQISQYVIAAQVQGHDVSGVIYNVIRKPTIRPRQIPTLDENGLKIVVDENGERVLTAQGKPRQTAGEGMTLLSRDETLAEWSERLLADIQERPEHYYQRREVPRLDNDLTEFRLEVWQQHQLLTECERHGRWFRTVHRWTCDYCSYNSICLQSLSVSRDMPPPAGFVFVDDLHPELQRAEIEAKDQQRDKNADEYGPEFGGDN